jgi:hypothetical protein
MYNKKIEKMPRIYISAAMRGGSTLISNILNAHSKIQILENLHFQRFLFRNGIMPNRKEIEFRLKEIGLRLKVRHNFKINEKKIIDKIKRIKKLNFKDIYDQIILEQLNINPKLKIVGEDSALNWRFIETFCKFYKNAKVIHLIRDPRSIYASWKNITYENLDRWGCLINCMDSMNYAIRLKKKLNKKNYIILKFEDVLNNPTKYSKILCKFLNIKFEKSMIEPKKWNKLFKGKFASLGWSSIENKKIDDFILNRIESWKNKINQKEVQIIEYFAKKYLNFFNYKISIRKVNKKIIKEFLKNIKKSRYLKKIFNDFIKYNKTTDELKKDPTNFRNWGNGKKNKEKFINSKYGKYYIKQMKKINLSLKK